MVASGSLQFVGFGPLDEANPLSGTQSPTFNPLTDCELPEPTRLSDEPDDESDDKSATLATPPIREIARITAPAMIRPVPRFFGRGGGGAPHCGGYPDGVACGSAVG
jgi:hypothetical protein